MNSMNSPPFAVEGEHSRRLDCPIPGKVGWPFLGRKSSATHPSVCLSTNHEVIMIHMGIVTFFQFLFQYLYPGVHIHGSEGVDVAKIHHPERFVIVLGCDDAVLIVEVGTATATLG